MSKKVAIVGVGHCGFRTTSQDVSYREMIFEAASKCYQDAGGVHPREIDSFVASSEDFMEGVSIADEYVPEQLGAVLKPVQSIAGDGLQGLASAMMQIQTGRMGLAAASAFSKASNVLQQENVVSYACDPSYVRPLGESPYALAGLEMNRYLHESGNTKEQCAEVAATNRRSAQLNPKAAYAANIDADTVLDSEPEFYPLSLLDQSQHADGAVVVLLASEDMAYAYAKQPIWIQGIGWATDTPNLDSRLQGLGDAVYARLAGGRAYRMAGISCPRREIDFAEIDDTFSYKQLQHLEALQICSRGEAGRQTQQGLFSSRGDFPVNISGGSLGSGYLHEANGLQRLLEVVLQLRGQAGPRQLQGVQTGLAFAWRGIPTATGTAVVLGNRY
ncbi:MAG: thiolase C-terminal domain-containing protein [Desulfohalobiaceae bacterium]